MSLARSLKVHLRVLDVRGTTLRVVTLRPQTRVRFSTNYFHDTWHILGDTDGADLFGTLLWGLAFQRQPGTLVLIDHPHIVPTPFDGDPPDPILLIPDGLTRFDADLLRALALRLRRDPGPPTTIRWHAFGLPAALERDRDSRRPWCTDRGPQYTREQMSRSAGFVCYTAPPEILRAQGLAIYRMGRGEYGGYHYLADVSSSRKDWRVDGEFQVISGFTDRVSAAITARREILGADRSIASEQERDRIYDRQAAALRRLHAAQRRGDRDADRGLA